MDAAERAKNLIITTLEERGISDRACLIGSGLTSTFLADWRSGKVKSPSFQKVYSIFSFLGLSLDNMCPLEACDAPVAEQMLEDEGMTDDEAELLRIYRMIDREGKTMVLSAAYTEKRRVAEQGSETSASANVV